MFREPGVFIYRLDLTFAKNVVRLLGRFEPRRFRQPPTLPLYYKGKVKKTIFYRNLVYVLRTTTARHMVSFINFYFHFLANFQT